MNYKQSVTFFVLFCLGVVLFYKQLLNNGFGVFNLQTYGELGQINFRASELIAKDIIGARFKSKEKNLGVISVRFQNGNRDSKDTIVFRTKVAEEPVWYYQAEYKTDQFQSGKLFPFGFPVIVDSKGKDIQFEIESLHGATGSGIYLDSHDPIFIASSFFSKDEILSSSKNALSFFGKKMINIIEDKQAGLSVISYFLPFIVYAVYIYLNGTSFHFLFVATLGAVSLQIISFSKENIIVYFSVVLLWILTIQRHKLESRVSGFIALVFLVVTPFLNITKQLQIAEKMAIWSYIFASIATVQVIIDKNKSTKQTTLETLREHWKDISYDRLQKRHLILVKLYLPTVWTLSIFVIYKTFRDIVYSINIYRGFFGSEINNSNITTYLFASVMTFFVFTSVLLYLQKKIKRNPIIVLLSLIVFRMTISALSANYTYFQYVPKIISLSPNKTSEAWVDITLLGKNFQDKPFVGKVTLNGEVQVENVWFWSNEKIIFRTNPLTTKTGEVCVQTLSKGSSNCLPFEYRFNQKQ